MQFQRQNLYFTREDKALGHTILTSQGRPITPERVYFNKKGFVVEKMNDNCVPKPEWIDNVINMAMRQLFAKKFKTFVFCVVFYEDDPFGVSIIGDTGCLSIYG